MHRCRHRGPLRSFTVSSNFRSMIPSVWLGGQALCSRTSRAAMGAARERRPTLSPVKSGRASAAIANDASCAGGSLRALAPKLFTLSTLLLAMTVVGCARHPERQARAARSGSRTCQAPVPPPDCSFRGSGLEPVDPAQFAQLKAAYERQCYQRAERAARERQRLLRASKACS